MKKISILSPKKSPKKIFQVRWALTHRDRPEGKPIVNGRSSVVCFAIISLAQLVRNIKCCSGLSKSVPGPKDSGVDITHSKARFLWIFSTFLLCLFVKCKVYERTFRTSKHTSKLIDKPSCVDIPGHQTMHV